MEADTAPTKSEQPDLTNGEKEEEMISHMGVHLPANGTYWMEPSDTKPCSTCDDFPAHISFQKLYRQHFVDKEHLNFLASSLNMGFVVMSVRIESERSLARILLRTQDKTHYYCGVDIEPQSATNPVILAKKVLPSLEVNAFCPLPFAEATKLILCFDEFKMQTNFKFGVIYQRAGQYSEEELLSNTDHSEEFESFLKLLGERVKLKGFNAFRGGLDVSCQGDCFEADESEEDVAGDSVYTNLKWSQLEDERNDCDETVQVMYHVSTLLPFTKNDKQQLARKRHIGNDIVAIVFQEKGALFNPTVITSNFLHAYVIVQPCVDQENDETMYQVVTVAKDHIPAFLPRTIETDNNLVKFHLDESFRNFLLKKVINAEVASVEYAETFLRLQKRTRNFLFDTLFKELLHRTGELFEPSGGLCPPNTVIKNEDLHKTPSANGKEPISNKLSGKFLKSIKRTFSKKPNAVAKLPIVEDSETTNEASRQLQRQSSVESSSVTVTNLSVRLALGSSKSSPNSEDAVKKCSPTPPSQKAENEQKETNKT